MAHLEETAVWTPGVYQLETTDPVLGGPVQPEPATGGIANRQALALANRTVYLRQTMQQAEAALSAQIDLKANIASPTLTGTPQAPTPPTADASTRIATTDHVHAALQAQIAASLARVFSITALPTSNLGPIIVAEASEVWIWVSTAHYTGYRSPLCGRPVDGHTIVPLASEIDAVGGLLSKSAYAGLWGYAQENGLVMSQADWQANLGAHGFVDVSNTQFRVPDLRNQFRRYTGTDADSANAREVGSRQGDALQNITGTMYPRTAHNIYGAILSSAGAFQTTLQNGNPGWQVMALHPSVSGYSDVTTFDASRVARTATETRPINTAYAPRIHV